MARVIIRQSSYDYEILRRHCFDILDQFCGDLIRKDSFVIIKPNFLSASSPEQAILTNPMIVKCAAEYVLSKGIRPQISDSPGTGSFERILRESGVKDALEGLDVEFKEFKQSVKVDIGEPFGQIDMAEDAIKADVLINLPKLKTHSQMLLTLGVKNLFGCIAGYRKAEWHMRAGVDRHMFARLLFQIYRTLNPAVTIVDGILASGVIPGREKPLIFGRSPSTSIGPSKKPSSFETLFVRRISGFIPNIVHIVISTATPLSLPIST
ncbi:unnamed protein product, partial [marine sediment metagenome]